jgi:hypothetical protein
MGEAQEIDLKASDEIAQAGMVLVEQVGITLLNDAYKLPKMSGGKMETDDMGTVKVDGVVDQVIKMRMLYKQDEASKYIGSWNHLDIKDSAGVPMMTVDKVNGGYLLDILLTNKLGTHADFRGANGDLKIQMDGRQSLIPHDATKPAEGKTLENMVPSMGVADAASTIKDPDGNYIGDIRLLAKPKKGTDNVLDIVATMSRGETQLGAVQMILTIDPKNIRKGDYKIIMHDPPPPPPVCPTCPGTGAKPTIAAPAQPGALPNLPLPRNFEPRLFEPR